MGKLIFEKSKSGRIGYTLPALSQREKVTLNIPGKLLRSKEPELPEVSEVDVIRHFIHLSTLNYHVDKGFYPLGSCTMKYNPKVNDYAASLPGFTDIHPLQPEKTVQGALRLMKELEEYLAEISGSGMDAVSLQPAAGAHGEFTGIKIIRKYHETQGNPRKYVLIPDSAHGTNPASVTLSGYIAKTIKSNEKGLINLEELKANLNEEVAAFMVTNPNTLGLFEVEIMKIADMVHSVGALMYLDGANMNAFIGQIRPGDTGFDVMLLIYIKRFLLLTEEEDREVDL